jgi:multidrug efflux system outer membrane protein
VYRDLSENPQAQAQAASFADLPWWQVFQDPQLQELIRTALKENYDLQLATERIAAARAQVTITRSNLFPQVQGNAAFAGGKDPTTQAKYNILALTADAAFQLDLFGRLRRATEAARAELLATEDARDTVILTLVSDVASDYFTLLQLDLELQITRDTVKTQEDSVKLTQLRLDHGVATKLDVLQAQQVLDIANAQIPDLERQIGQEEDAISILLGHDPEGVRRGRPLASSRFHRKCRRACRRRCSNAGRTFARSSKIWLLRTLRSALPKLRSFRRFRLPGSGGGAFGRSTLLSGLMSSQTGIWSYGAQVNQPIFTGGALSGNLRLSKSQYRQELIAYQQTIQLAFRDVSDALIGYQKLHEVRVAQETTVKDLQDSVDTSLVRYRGGITTYLEVLDGQRSLFTAELVLAQARGNEYQSLVQLYKALGGGWQVPNSLPLQAQNIMP